MLFPGVENPWGIFPQLLQRGIVFPLTKLQHLALGESCKFILKMNVYLARTVIIKISHKHYVRDLRTATIIPIN